MSENNFKEFYENLIPEHKKKLKREICQICDFSESSFSRKKTGSLAFSKLEREAIVHYLTENFIIDEIDYELFFNTSIKEYKSLQ